MTHLPMRSERSDVQRVIFNKPWCNNVNLCTIVQESHAALPVDSYSCYILDPISSVKGVQIQEGSLCLAFYAWSVSSWGTFGVTTFLEGLGLPSLVPFPLSSLQASHLGCCHQWGIVDEVI